MITDARIEVARGNSSAKLSRKDFASDQDIRWCPGCGDYSILAQIQRVLPEIGVPREKIVFISGIGCSSRLPYYMSTYGFHSIHGRAPTVASGLKMTRPDLSVWVITGDGDGLSIGGNHLLHALRRNLDLNIILFNNQIYGLTKGQYSPTSEYGKQTKSSPIGSIDFPIRPVSVALAAEASFVARSIDKDPKHLQETLLRAAKHRGTSFVEVYQNCNIFNDKAFDSFTDKSLRSDRMVRVEHGKPLVFGENNEKGIHLGADLVPQVVSLDDRDAAKRESESLLVHDEQRADPTLAIMLDRMTYPQMPVPFGVFRAVERPVYEDLMSAQLDLARERRPPDLEALYRAGDIWRVESSRASD